MHSRGKGGTHDQTPATRTYPSAARAWRRACLGDSAGDATEPTLTAATGTLESTAGPTATQEPVPTDPSTPLGIPPAIDTSTWLTYASPLGFEIKYPPTWTLDVPTDRHTRIVNPVYKAALDDAIRQGYVGTGLPPVAGMEQFNIIMDTAPGFDIGNLTGSCEHAVRLTTFRSLRAVSCEGTSVISGGLLSTGRGLWVKYPPGHTTLVGGSVVTTAEAELTTVEAIFNTVSFVAEQ